MAAVIAPGSRVGVLGGGQLGRMFAMAARRLGYRVHTLAPEGDTPTGQISDLEINAPYDDLDAVARFARGVDVVTFEFENVPAAAAATAERHAIVRPNGKALHVAQNRIREKAFVADLGIAVTPFAAVRSDEDLRAATARIGCPAVLKTASFGYDGKGQVAIAAADQAAAAWERLGRQESIVEAFVSLEREISVIAARGADGSIATFAPFENAHRDHILDLSVSPAAVSTAMASQASEAIGAVMEALDYVGLLCLEFFVTTDGRLLFNEMAPRPHNSGHLTFDACRTSQFEQQLRAICGLPLGAPDLVQPAAMANLLGHLWSGGEPDWPAALAFPDVKLHLYGKAEARPGRKMGHLAVLAASVDAARTRVLEARAALTSHPVRPA